MTTKYLDEEIKFLEELFSTEGLLPFEEEKLKEFREIKKQLTLTDVVQRSELLLAVICEYNKINTYKEIKKVEKWLEKWDSK